MFEFMGFLRNDNGAVAIEYVVIASVMGVALIAVIPVIAEAVTRSYTTIASHIASGS